jgi:predicted nucleotide-binding protein (sugar kinase/HSP70/actin superfamily)
MYESEYRYALDNAGFEEFRVLLFQQSKDVMKQDQEPGLKYTADLGMGALNALILGDVTSDLIYQIRPYEVNPGETERVFDECVDYLACFLRDRAPFEILEASPPWASARLAREKWRKKKNLLNNLGKFREHFWGTVYMDALEECRQRINRIEVDRTRVKPIVKITGEFFSQTSESPANYNMFAFLEGEGAQVQTEPISSWITYLLYQARARWVNHKRVNAPHQRPHWWEIRKRLGNEMHFQKRHRLLKFADRMYNRLYRRATHGLGGLAHQLVSQEELARLAHSFYHTLARGGEAHLEVGKNIYYTENKLCHMVLSLKPFGCMPSQLSDGVQSAVVNRYRDMIFLPVETSGDGEVHAHSRVQMALSEAKLKAKKEFQQALESTGKSLEKIKGYVSKHPRLTRSLYHVPHRSGFAGVAANFVLHVSDLMDGKTNGRT